MHLVVTGPGYDIVEVLHVASAVVAFGSLAATGWYSALLRQRAEPSSDVALLRYFRPGRNWAEFALFLVPVFGGALVAMAGRSETERAWPWIGLGIWVVAVGAATAVVFPSERAIQRLLVSEAGRDAVARAARRCEQGSAVTAVCFVAALVVMIAKPG